MTEGLPPQYDPKPVERKWYSFWEDNHLFQADPSSDKPPFTIVIPPPNVTGILHLGHVLNNTIQDILIRWKRMEGYETLWMPGTDHAGIATQVVVEKALANQGIDRKEMGREAFIGAVWKWRKEYGGTIIRQLKSLGCACDWERERFTMDEGLSKAVIAVFISLYEKKKIYRGHRIINWCPRCRTALSNEEAIPQDENGSLWYMKYPLKDGSGYIPIATTRPETMLGDTAVAVHPEDGRYAHLIGKQVQLPLTDRDIPIIADSELVDPAFGTGAVKVTPAHDPNDFIMGQKHNLPTLTVMDEDGLMNVLAGERYQSMDRFDCRKTIIQDMTDLGFLDRTEAHSHAVPHCQRCDTILEPRLSQQWFLNTKPFAEQLLKTLEENKIPEFTPDHWIKTYKHWLENIEDWCISRQLWWGHRIPIWYCDHCETIHAGVEAPEKCKACGHLSLRQDEDVLDTWFSSSLWPFSTMGWPEKTLELAKFYPTSTLVTGHDILFFWVARMMMMGYEFMGKQPFDDVYLTSLVRDIKGRKLSKSLGNSPDPLEVMDTYGTDAVRFAMMLIAPHGQDIYYSNDRIDVGRNFANKLWNAARFVLMNQQHQIEPTIEPTDLWDRWILSRLSKTTNQVTKSLKAYGFHETALQIYDFFWHDFCDWYLEAIKQRLYDKEDSKSSGEARQIALHVLENTLRLLHPFMPFITEEIWQHLKIYLPGDMDSEISIMNLAWPESNPDYLDQSIEEDTIIIQDLIGSVREVRADFNVHPSHNMDVYCLVHHSDLSQILTDNIATINSIAHIQISMMSDEMPRPTGSASGVLHGLEFFVPLADLIDLDVETDRLSKERDRVAGELEKVKKRLANNQFIEKAPADVIKKEHNKQDNYIDMISRLERNLDMIMDV
jgi:valyl-tRNA synthetase